MSLSFLNNHAVRGIRNNNPGNIRVTADKWQGEIPNGERKDADFEQFYELKWGVRAFYKLIYNYIAEGNNTIAKIVSKYAPKNENNTTSYINHVVNATGWKKDGVIVFNQANITKLAKAMFAVENGASAAKLITEAVYSEAYGLLGVNFAAEVKKVCEHCGQIIAGLFIGVFTFYTIFKA